MLCLAGDLVVLRTGVILAQREAGQDQGEEDTTSDIAEAGRDISSTATGFPIRLISAVECHNMDINR